MNATDMPTAILDQPTFARPRTQQPRMRHKAPHGRHRQDARRLAAQRLAEEHLSPASGSDNSAPRTFIRHGAPPAPPLKLTPSVACNPNTDPAVLWHIAHSAPELRRWLVANPRATPQLLEYVAQAGGPGVHEAIEVLLDLLERQQRR
ncbi:hypothetical protein [Bifidobacterium sp. UBA744]|uniref:variant leucine-rich repeat-containing protein n=1 Tax=Bifidobacterium sp. UBA744 TaxID=1946112 RepID=UPI0025C0EBF1|nr:hypothetical protein [Bifidobacterium sp. UBA744]